MKQLYKHTLTLCILLITSISLVAQTQVVEGYHIQEDSFEYDISTQNILNAETMEAITSEELASRAGNEELAGMGIIWSHSGFSDYPGALGRITKQENGYLASGNITFNGRQRGYVVHFSEAGVILSQWILTPPSELQWTASNTGTSSVTFAFLTSDNDLVTFGLVHNVNVPNELKGHDLGSLGNINFVNFLRKGIWVSKIKYDDKMGASPIINRLDRGNSRIGDMMLFDKDKFLMTGYDYIEGTGVNFLFRMYDKDLKWIYDNYATNGAKLSNLTWLADFYRGTKPNSFLISGSGGIVREYTFDGTNMTYDNTKVNGREKGLYLTKLENGQGCVTAVTTNETHPKPMVTSGPTTSWSFKIDGGFWGMGRMGNIVMNNVPYNQWVEHGYVVYKKGTQDNLIECKILNQHNERRTYSLGKAYLMANSTTRYVGSGWTPGGLKHYVLDDLPNDFDLQIQPTPAPKGASINLASKTDGFLGTGRDPLANEFGKKNMPSIIKFSTCDKFKIKDLPPFKIYYVAPAATIKIEQNYDYLGAVGTVTYDLKAVVEHGLIDGKGPNTVLYDYKNLSPVNATRLLNLSNTFQLGSGQAQVKFTLSIRDSYTTAGVAQSCGQTYELYLVTGPKTDVVAIPHKVGTGANAKMKMTFKNIGYTPFDPNYKITVYANNLGNSVKQTYTLAEALDVNATANIEIPLESDIANVSKWVVRFNDKGDGARDQFETDNIQFTYTVE